MYAKLVGHDVVEIGTDTLQWARAFEKSSDRIVKQTILSKRKRRIMVSTVFLGMDHGWGSAKLWFETMVFGTSIDGAEERYTTWEQAEKGHAKMVGRARQARKTKAKRYTRKSMNKLMRRSRRLMKGLTA